MLRSTQSRLLASFVAVFVAALVGVQLGHGAIAGIDPVFFQGPAPPPQAVDGTIRQPRPPEYLEAYGWQQGHDARMAECGVYCYGRSAYESYSFAQGEPAAQPASQEWRETTAPAELEPWPAGEVRVVRGQEAVARYADFPIEQKPPAVEEEAVEPEPEVQRADYQEADVYEE